MEGTWGNSILLTVPNWVMLHHWECHNGIDLSILTIIVTSFLSLPLSLSSCHKLQYLNMSYCEHISDTGIELLSQQLLSLIDIDMTGCGVTDLVKYPLTNHLLWSLPCAGCVFPETQPKHTTPWIGWTSSTDWRWSRGNQTLPHVIISLSLSLSLENVQDFKDTGDNRPQWLWEYNWCWDTAVAVQLQTTEIHQASSMSQDWWQYSQIHCS